MKKIYNILIIGIILIFISIIYPIGLGITTPTESYYNDDIICLDCNVPPDYFLINLLIILLPIICILAIIIYFYPSKSENNHEKKAIKDF